MLSKNKLITKFRSNGIFYVLLAKVRLRCYIINALFALILPLLVVRKTISTLVIGGLFYAFQLLYIRGFPR